MKPPVYRIKGHHLKNLIEYVKSIDSDPNKFYQTIIDQGYGVEFAWNEMRIWREFVSGLCEIKLVTNELDDLCLCKCERKNRQPKPCNSTENTAYDMEIAAKAHLEIGKPHRYEAIEENLKVLHLRELIDQGVLVEEFSVEC